MRVLIRADADARRGGGHIMRCLTLAEALREQGHAVMFQSNPEARDTVPALARAGFDDDGSPVDAIVVDHYDCEVVQEQHLRAARRARVLAVLDDLADRSHACDLLVDFGAGRAAGDYAGLIPRGATVLAGPAHAIVRQDVVALRARSLERRAKQGRLDRIVVAFGLSDATPYVAAAVEACRVVTPDIRLDVITGPAGRAGAAAAVEGWSGALLHVDPASYAALLADCDVAIGAVGGAAFERCVLGLPAITVPIAANQRANALALTEAGAVVNVETGVSLADRIAAALEVLRLNPLKRAAMSAAAASFCDGGGAARVAAAIGSLVPVHATYRDGLTFRPAQTSDARFLWAWRNDPAVRAQSRTTDPISFVSHCTWLADRLSSARTQMILALAGDEPVGVVRFDRTRSAAEVSITISPLARGRGFGRAILRQGCTTVIASGFASHITAVVRRDNAPSCALFASVGFHLSRRGGDWIEFALAAMPPGDRRSHPMM